MKYKYKISALLLALLFLVASNGVAVFEHICSTSNARDYSFFWEITCKMEKTTTSCCAKPTNQTNKNDCCNHKQYFSKLNVEGFTANPVVLKHNLFHSCISYISLPIYNINVALAASFYSGLAPPNNIAVIQSLLQPSSIKLQVFRC
jgi:hypothetical protein